MTLRGKLRLAQLPLIVALLLSGGAGGYFLSVLGRGSGDILRDNYRSVLAAQRMKDAIEQLDGAALRMLAGESARAEALQDEEQARFEAELRIQESNLTEPSEREATERLRRAWTDYQREYDAVRASASEPAGLQSSYIARLQPALSEVRAAADRILVLNQDAIVRKSDRAQQLAVQSTRLLSIVVAVGLLLALYATAAITNRVLRPLSVLGLATRRVGEGDLAARAQVPGSDEVAQLAADFNAMAEHLQKYRASTLGELLAAQRVSQATIDSLPDPVLVLAGRGEILHINRAAEDGLQLNVEGGGLGPLAPELREVLERVQQHSVTGKGSYVPRGLEEAIRVVTREGERYFLPRATPLYAEEGDVVGTTVVLQDVTRLLRFEQLRNDVVATVAHEFRTPLTSLRMAIHLLLEERIGSLTAKQADLVYAAREDSERLQGTVDELLDLSRIQSGRMDLRLREIDAESLAADAVESQRSLASETDVLLRSEVLPGSGRVRVDPQRLQIALANLLQNAIRHSPRGETVVVRVTSAGDQLRFHVIDRGGGIPVEHQPRVFEKYFQIPGRASGSAGLGLFLAREIVHAHGGDIGVESAPGNGSDFWFQLPLAKRSEEGQASG